MRRLLLLIVAVMMGAWGVQAQCPPPAALSTPYFEDFDGEASGQTGTYGNCWVASSTSDPNWETESSGTGNSSNTGPLNDVSGSGIYVYMETSGGSPGDVDSLTTPDIDLSNLSNPELTFYYHMFGGAMGTLAVEIWDGSTWTQEWTLSGQQQTAETDPWRLAIVDLSSYSGVIAIRFVGTKGSPVGGASGWESDMSIDEVRVDEAITCPLPQFLTASQVTATTAVVGWDSVMAATSGYTVIYGTAGFNPATGGTSVTATADSVQLTGLSGATTYEAYVIANCGAANGISDTAGPVSFQTLCVALTAPYARNFDTDAVGAPALCWSEYNNYNSLARANVQDNPPFVTAFSAPNVIEMYSYTGFSGADTLMAVSPQFSDLTGGDKQIRFQGATNDASSQLIIGTTSSQTPGSAITPLDTISFAGVSTWEEIIYPITTSNGYNGTDEYVVLMYDLSTAATFDYIFIDDFNYEVIPPCPKVTSLSGVSTTDTSFTISFTTSGSAVDVEWGPAGFAQGTGCLATNLSGNPLTVSNSTPSSCTGTQIAPGTAYDVYVRNNCTVGGNGTSVWSGPITVVTSCASPAQATLPIIEDFENISGTYFGNASFCNPSYNIEFIASDPAGRLRLTAGPLFPNSGTNAATLDRDPSGGNQINYLIFTVDMTAYVGANNIELDFQFMHHGEESHPNDRVWVRGNRDSAWVEVYDLNANQGSSGAYNSSGIIDVDAALSNAGQVFSSSFQIRFGQEDNFPATSPTLSDGYTFDDIRLRAPSCFDPSALTVEADSTTANSIYARWTSGGNASGHIVEVGPAGFTPGTGAATVRLNVPDTFVTVTGLTSNTAYDIYVQDSCGGGNGLSAFVGPESVNTSCLVQPAPFFENFENTSATVTCWQNVRITGTQDWTLGTGSSGGAITAAFSGTQNAVFTSSFTGGTSRYVSPEVDVSSLVNPQLSFYFGQEEFFGDQNELYIYVRGTQSPSWTQIYSNTSNVPAWTGDTVVLPLGIGDTVQIAFEGVDNFGRANVIDDVRIDNGPSCPAPVALNATNLTDSSGTLEWSATSGTIGQYEVWFGPVGFFQGTLTAGGVRTFTTADSLVVDTLTDNSCYEFLVRNSCVPGDTSAWAGPFSFCTPCAPFFAPYAENFDGPNQTVNTVPNCWGDVIVGSNASAAIVDVYQFGTPRSAPHHLRLSNSSNNNLIMATSPFMGDMTAGDKRVTFYGRESFASSPNETIIVGTVPSQNSTNLDTIATFVTSAQNQRFIANITAANGYNGTDQYFAIVHGNTSTFNTLYIDDLVYEVIPTCPEPLSGTVLNTTNTTADISFVSGGAANFQIDFGPPGFTPSGSSANLVNTTTTTPTITGLLANTVYEWYVRDSCGVGDVSTWTGPFSFQTLCNPFTAPYFQDFENSQLGHWDGIDDCWLFRSDNPGTSAGGGYSWEVRNTAPTSSNTGPGLDNTLAPNPGGNFITADLSGSGVGDTTYLISPIVDISGLSNGEVEYHVHRFGTIMADLFVDIYDGSNWVNVHSYTNQAGLPSTNSRTAPYVDTIIKIDTLGAITNFQVRFRSVSNGGFSGDNAIDDIRISDPITGDLDLISSDFDKSLCPNTNDTISLTVVNTVNATVDFSVNNLTGFYSVTGPVNSTGNFTVNTGTLPANDTLVYRIGGIDLSQAGNYNLDAYIDTSFINKLGNRDTLRGTSLIVLPEFETNPDTVILASAGDSAEICVVSDFFGGAADTSAITTPPLTGNNGSGGITFEVEASQNVDMIGLVNQFSTAATANLWMRVGGVQSTPGVAPTISAANGWTQVVSAGTVNGANGLAPVFMDFGGTTITLQANQRYGFFIEGNTDYQTGTAADPTAYSDGIVTIYVDDNAAYGGGLPNPTFNPRRFLGGIVYERAAASGLTWSLNGVTVDTTTCITVGPFASPGTFTYVADYTNPCGSYTDSVVVIVPSCFAPDSLRGFTISQSSVALAFDTAGTFANQFEVEYGLEGFSLGSGTRTTITGDSIVITGIPNNVCYEYYVRSDCGGGDSSAWAGPINICPEEVICQDDMENYATGLIEGQSALFLNWQGVAGAANKANITTAQSSSASQSLMLSNVNNDPNDHDDVVAYFDTISSGAWEVSFEMYVPNNRNGYFNIQQSHVFAGATGTNQWNAEVYLQGNGLAEVQYTTTTTTTVGTFNYSQGVWNEISTIIDLDNDTIWFEVNGTSTNVGFVYSDANPGQPIQFNGVNFFTGVLAGDPTGSEYYIDDFCVDIYTPGTTCPPVNGYQSTNIACDSVTLDWVSNTGGSIVEYGPQGFQLGTGISSGIVTPPYTVTNLIPGTSYDFKVADTCGIDTSAYRTLTEVTATGPLPTASFTIVSETDVAGTFEVVVDASGSTNATSYSWDYGNGTTGTGVIDTGFYNNNQTFDITLVVTNGCGTDTVSQTIDVNIGLEENALENSLSVFPNPTYGELEVSFKEVGAADVNIRLTDVQGRIVKEWNDNLQSGTYRSTLDVSELAAGIYMLNVKSGDMTAVRRISVKQ